MTRTLRLLRHATAVPSYAARSDIDRTLAPEGVMEAKVLASTVAEEWQLDYCLCSAAIRARQTLRPLQELQDFPVAFSEDLYGAGASTLIEATQQVPDEYDEVLLVGHNPGMSRLASHLLDQHVSLGTAEHTTVTLQLGSWSELC